LVEGTDNGIWRRLELIKFPYTFQSNPEDVIGSLDVLGDPTLRARCESDPEIWAAALTWMIEGAFKWYLNIRIMPEPPGRVQKDSFSWRKESDQILCYIDDRLIFHPDWHIPTMDLLDRREVDPPIEVESATWSAGGQLDWWVKERQQWLGCVRGKDGRQRWIKAGDLRPASRE
jgi:hypothetical protein